MPEVCVKIHYTGFWHYFIVIIYNPNLMQYE